MTLSKKELLSYFVPLSDKDGTEKSIRIKGCFNTYFIRRKGANSMHYYLRQRLILRHSGKHISINHGCWEDNNIPSVREFKQLLKFCNCCYLAAVNGQNPAELKDLSMFAGIANKNALSTKRILHKNTISSSDQATSSHLGQSDTLSDINAYPQRSNLNSDEAVSSNVKNTKSDVSFSIISDSKESGMSSSKASKAHFELEPKTRPGSSSTLRTASSFRISYSDNYQPNSVYPSYCTIEIMGIGLITELSAISNNTTTTNSIKQNEISNFGLYLTPLTTDVFQLSKTDYLFRTNYRKNRTKTASSQDSRATSSNATCANSYHNNNLPGQRFCMRSDIAQDTYSRLLTQEISSAFQLLLQNTSSFGVHQSEDVFVLTVLYVLLELLSERTNCSGIATKEDFCHSQSKPPRLSDSYQNTSRNAAVIADGDSMNNSFANSDKNNAEHGADKWNAPNTGKVKPSVRNPDEKVTDHYDTVPIVTVSNNNLGNFLPDTDSPNYHSLSPNANDRSEQTGTMSHRTDKKDCPSRKDSSPGHSSISSENEKASIALEQLCSEYLAHRALRPKTVLFYEKIIKSYIAPHFSKFSNLKDLTVFRAATIIIKPIVDAGKFSTAHNTRNTLVAIINHARLVHELSDYPHLSLFNALSQVAKIPSKSEYEKSYPAMIDGDIGENIRRIFKLFHEKVKNVTILALIELSFHFCLRQNEMLSIRIGNINFEEHRLHITETKTITSRNGGFDIPLNPHTEKLLRTLIEYKKQARQKLLNHVNPPEKLNPETKHINTKEINNAYSTDISNNNGKKTDVNDDNQYLFCSTKSTGNIPLSPNVLGIYLNRIPELRHKQTAHGIRAVFRTWAHRNKISDTTSECVLSHKCWSKVAVSYNRDLATYLYTDRQELMKIWSDFIVSNIGSYTFLNSASISGKNNLKVGVCIPANH